MTSLAAAWPIYGSQDITANIAGPGVHHSF